MECVLFVVSLGASILGAACGIGGGIIIKPVLDALHVADVTTISFLSGCSVLTMASYSVLNEVVAGRNNKLDWKKTTPIAAGAAVGGFIGKFLFGAVSQEWENIALAGALQSALLCIIMGVTICYMIKREHVKTRNTEKPLVAGTIGFLMGSMCSFLGIGGGPINLVILYYFFSMPNKAAAHSSLYIICISQVASLFASLTTQSIPAFNPLWLFLMVVGGLSGGVIGRKIGERLNEEHAQNLLLWAMLLIMGICILNCVGFTYRATSVVL